MRQKMEKEKSFDDISNLPPEAQRQVAGFIAFLKTRYKRSDAEKQADQSCQ
jgi:DNA replication initiation complex subunit (GINS family)